MLLKCAGINRREVVNEESCRKGLANHPDLESCMAGREVVIETLIGAYAGSVVSCEIIATGVPTSFSMAEGNTEGTSPQAPGGLHEV